MKFFKFGKKNSVIDLTDMARKIEKPGTSNRDLKNDEVGVLNLLGNLASGTSTENSSSVSSDFPIDIEERKKKFMKRFMDMTTRIEDISTQLYHLQQRVELLEKKLDVNRF